MGGAVKPVVKAVGDVGGAIGIMKKTGLAPSVAEAKAMIEEKTPSSKASRMDEEQGARMRGAKRRGRQLLSDARLNETGNETLGGGNNLG